MPASAVAWERPTGSDGAAGEGYFRAEYVIQMTTDQVETETKMQTLKQGGGLKWVKRNSTDVQQTSLAQSNQFSNREKDVLSAILEEGKAYTVQQAKDQMTTFLKKEVI